VKFLIDANLPPRLCAWLKSRRHDADHLFDLVLLDATDTEIWRRGEVQNLVIAARTSIFTIARCFSVLHPALFTWASGIVATLGFSRFSLSNGMKLSGRFHPDQD
jgi:predicted nuclease of predicted toxin-antitoxin system